MTGRRPVGSPLAWLLGATVLCYAIGYPLALLGNSVVGWVFVFLGGPLLIALGVLVIRRVHRGIDTPAHPPAAGRQEASPPR